MPDYNAHDILDLLRPSQPYSVHDVFRLQPLPAYEDTVGHRQQLPGHGIDTGGQPLPPGFPRRRIQRSPYQGFRNPPPYNPLTGHNEPLLPGGPRVALFTVVEEFDDYLVCNGFDPYSGRTLEDVAVAKPHVLQKTPWDGESVEYKDDLTVSYTYTDIGKRTASADDEDDETQQITPDYFEDEVITVMRAKTESGDFTGISDRDGNRIEWVDLNSAGRAWAVVQ